MKKGKENPMINLNEAKEALSTVKTLMISGPAQFERPFYGQFLMRMNVQWTDKVPTAGVSITDTLNLYINPTFFLGLNLLEKIDLIEHEILHIVYMHPLRSKELGDEINNANHKMHNIAADAKVNENLKEITKNIGVTLQRLNDALQKQGSKDVLVQSDSSETYYWTLKKNQEISDEDSGYGEVDDHGTWQESVANEAMAKAVVSKIGNEASQAAGIGSTPSEILKQLQNLSKSLVNWKQQLRQFFANALKHDHERTRNRRNRRYGLLQSGRRKKQKLNIACLLDSSGSVGDEQFKQFFAELDSIVSSSEIEVTIIEADTQVSAVYPYKKGMEIVRHSCGGTLYQGAIDKAKELRVDGAILFGDFDSADTPTNPGMPFLWVGVNTSSKPPGNFGKAIYIQTV
jgi:predicted metal-dependent peptidase